MLTVLLVPLSNNSLWKYYLNQVHWKHSNGQETLVSVLEGDSVGQNSMTLRSLSPHCAYSVSASADCKEDLKYGETSFL